MPKRCERCNSIIPKVRCKYKGKKGLVFKNSARRTCWHCETIRAMQYIMDRPERIRERFSGKSELILRNRSKYSQLWNQDNPVKTRASRLARYYVDYLTILYECPCDIPFEKKHKHHHDYSKPLEVIVLCPECHAAWHAKLRKQKAV